MITRFQERADWQRRWNLESGFDAGPAWRRNHGRSLASRLLTRVNVVPGDYPRVTGIAGWDDLTVHVLNRIGLALVTSCHGDVKMSLIRDLALALRFLLELAAIVAVTWWGFTLGAPIAVQIIVGLAAPVGVIILWGAVVSPRPRWMVPGWARQLAEALVWLAALGALLTLGATGFAGLFAVLVVLDRVVLLATAGSRSRLEPASE